MKRVRRNVRGFVTTPLAQNLKKKKKKKKKNIYIYFVVVNCPFVLEQKLSVGE